MCCIPKEQKLQNTSLLRAEKHFKASRSSPVAISLEKRGKATSVVKKLLEYMETRFTFLKYRRISNNCVVKINLLSKLHFYALKCTRRHLKS